MFASLLGLNLLVKLSNGIQFPLLQPDPGPEHGNHNASTDLTNANAIFCSLAGLLEQLPNTLHPNGHAIIPAVISARTLLYHARRDSELPPKQEWLGFEPEMSYSIMVPKGEAHLSTYSANRDLHVLYFDGMSAQWGSDGVLDTQEVFIARKGGKLSGFGWFDDYARLQSLCKWAKGMLVDGFIRMNTGFELMWCDFDDGLDFVSHINVTAPDTPAQPEWPGGPPRRPRNLTSHELDTAPPEGPDRPRGPPGRRPPWHSERSPFTLSSGYEWLRIATRRYHSPQPQTRLITSGMLTFYDPRFTSLSGQGVDMPVNHHRVWTNVSDGDARLAVDIMERTVRRKDIWTKRGLEWEWMARRVQEHWADRIAQINYVLTANASSDSSSPFNATRAVENARLIAYSLINPYLDTLHLPVANQSEPLVWLPSTVERCTTSTTVFISPDDLTSQERLLKAAIETVLQKLCKFAGQVFADSIGASRREDTELVNSWRSQVSSLMRWLDWPQWTTCDEQCGWNSLCLIPLWPVIMEKGPNSSAEAPYPRCVFYDEWTSGPQGTF